MMTELDERGFVFLGHDNKPYRCCLWGGSPWLFSWHPDKHWVSLRPVTQTDVWLLPHNLTAEQQQMYFNAEVQSLKEEQVDAFKQDDQVDRDEIIRQLKTPVERKKTLTFKEAIALEEESQRQLKAKIEEKNKKESDYWRSFFNQDEIERQEKALYSVKNWAEQILGIAQRIRDDNDIEQIHKIVAQSRQIILEANQAIGISDDGQ
jgi:hypothetical protein